MKRSWFVFAVFLAFALGLAQPASAQMGMDMFKRPAITKVVHLVVPAGAFSCEHWRNDKNNANSWTSDKITPLGLVKETHSGGGMLLTRVLEIAADPIPGPVKQFDMRQLMQQCRQQPQK